MLLGSSAEAIYEDLITKEKELINNIPLKYLASYIGVTPKIKSNKEKSSLIRQLIFRSTFALENDNGESVMFNLLYKVRNLSK